MHRVTSSSARRLGLGLAALLTAVALGAAPAPAQTGKLTGVVTDAGSGQPIEGVQVVLQGTGYGAITQANGRYFILAVPPGNYAVQARRIGYQTQQVQNVSILIDVTREVNFRMSASAAQLSAVLVQQSHTPLIQPGVTGSADNISAEQLRTLPVTDIREALSLQAGFLAVPQNTDVLSYTDVRRALTPVRIRGGRPAESLTLVDGIPVNNFLFGGAALDLSTDAVQQIDYVRGGFEPQYGNALSGIVNIAVKEGTTDLRGSLEAQSSAVGGVLGSDYDDARNYQQVQGFLSGSIPATRNRLRYLFSGRQRSSASAALSFDQKVWNPLADVRDERQNFASVYDLFAGERAVGYDHQRDLIGKMSFYFTPVSKLNFTVIDYARQSQPYSFDWLQTGFDAYAQCVAQYPTLEDVCRRQFNSGRTVSSINDLQDTGNENWYVRQASTNQQRRLYVGSFNQTIGRLNVSAALGQFDQERNTCTFVSGVCQGTRIAYTYINTGFIYTGGRSRNKAVPLFGTEKLTGGDNITTRVGRADIQWQVTDHHNIQTGVFGQQHDVSFGEWRDVGLNLPVLQGSEFKAKPWDAAFYVQDRIEYDFLTLKIGARFDYGRAPGRFFADPRDPTNGTTARDVCLNPTAFGLAEGTFRTTLPDNTTVTGVAACSASDSLKFLARDVAAKDDWKDAPARRQFSPRIGVQFPLSESSSLFFNFGRFAQNPAMYDLYRNTGIGLEGEGTPAAVRLVQQSGTIPLIGNPQLRTEIATSYELGYAVEFLRDYALRATAFNKDQNNLTGIREGGVRNDGTRVNDFGSTYGSATPSYNVLVNTDFQVARGIELSLRRRLANFWAFDLNYSLSRVTTNAAPPDLEAQKRAEGDPEARKQIRSEVDQPHVFNGTLRFQADERAPGIRYVGRLLRNSALTATIRAASGLPYTPQLDFTGGTRLERNSGSAPPTFSIDLYGSKDWNVGNVRVGSFLRVTNLLNRRNCVQVFPSTGQCESGALTLGRLENGRIGASFGATRAVSQAFDRPDFISAPRAITGGLRLSF